MRKSIALLPLLLVLAFAAEAFAQPDLDDYGEPTKPEWIRGVDEAVENPEKKYILVYIHPPREKKDPTLFSNHDLIKASHANWGFVKMYLDPENRLQEQWGIKTAPVFVGCDRHGNDFHKIAGAQLNGVRGLIRSLPAVIQKFEARLKADYDRAVKDVSSDPKRSIGRFVNIVLLDKIGYKEIGESLKLLEELAEEDFKKGELIESADTAKALVYYEDLVRTYKTTPVGLKVEIRIARIENSNGRIQSALKRLRDILKLRGHYLGPVREAARKAIDEISKEGDAKIEAALLGDATKIREKLLQISRDYDDTEAGRRALWELRRHK
jgi:hypothetical protein